MKIFVSVDMEGMAGIVSPEQCRPGSQLYPASQLLMSREANAAIEGAFDGGALDVVVADGHADYTNLLPHELDSRAKLVTGRPRGPYGALQGLDDSFDAVFLVGYHAAAGVGDAVRAHTVSGAALYDVRVDGTSVSEAELHGLVAASFGVPVALVTGDDAVCRLAEERFDGVQTAPVKSALGVIAASSAHPDVACAAIRRAAMNAAKAPPQPADLPNGPFQVEVDLHYLEMAEACELLPGASRCGRTVRISTNDTSGLMQAIEAFVYLAQSAPGPGRR